MKPGLIQVCEGEGSKVSTSLMLSEAKELRESGLLLRKQTEFQRSLDIALVLALPWKLLCQRVYQGLWL